MVEIKQIRFVWVKGKKKKRLKEPTTRFPYLERIWKWRASVGKRWQKLCGINYFNLITVAFVRNEEKVSERRQKTCTILFKWIFFLFIIIIVLKISWQTVCVCVCLHLCSSGFNLIFENKWSTALEFVSLFFFEENSKCLLFIEKHFASLALHCNGLFFHCWENLRGSFKWTNLVESIFLFSQENQSFFLCFHCAHGHYGIQLTNTYTHTYTSIYRWNHTRTNSFGNI